MIRDDKKGMILGWIIFKIEHGLWQWFSLYPLPSFRNPLEKAQKMD